MCCFALALFSFTQIQFCFPGYSFLFPSASIFMLPLIFFFYLFFLFLPGMCFSFASLIIPCFSTRTLSGVLVQLVHIPHSLVFSTFARAGQIHQAMHDAYLIISLIQFVRAASRHDLSHRLVVSVVGQTVSRFAKRIADYPTNWASLLVGKFVECGIEPFSANRRGH